MYTRLGPSSNVSATAFGVTDGPVDWNFDETILPETRPFTTISSPGVLPR